MSQHVRLVATLNIGSQSPRELRAQFCDAIRAAVMRAHSAKRIESAIAEELLRVLPERNPRQ